jgi:hypothetical protein
MKTLQQYSWQLIAILEFLVIIWLILRSIIRHRKRTPETDQIIQSKRHKVDMEGLMNDLHLSGDLFKELARKCHPDRFAGTDLEGRANELFQLIQQHKTNYRELVALKETAKHELKIQLS